MLNFSLCYLDFSFKTRSDFRFFACIFILISSSLADFATFQTIYPRFFFPHSYMPITELK